MKVKINKTVEACDFCEREGYLQTCVACRKRYCLSCHGIVPGCWVAPNLCGTCDERTDVREVVKRHAEKITPIVAQRDKELGRLGGKP